MTGVNFYDKFRFKLIDETAILKANAKGDEDQSQVQSVTSQVTIYHIPSRWIKKNRLTSASNDSAYCINLIDTPGFGDTGGACIDKGIFTMISASLKKLEAIDFILLTTKASETRFTDQTEHIMSQIQDLFAKNVRDRFFAMCTFSDGVKPLALAGFKSAGIDIQNYAKFNNSNMFLAKPE